MPPFRKIFLLGKKDRDALIVLAVIFIACIVAYPFLSPVSPETAGDKGNSHANTSENTKGTRKSSRYTQADEGYGDGSRAVPPSERRTLTPFPFDPNTADSTTLLRLGMKPWQVRRIYKYRARGGYFHRPADFARLYGLTASEYRQLELYIRIKGETPASEIVGTELPAKHGKLPESHAEQPATRHEAPRNTYTRQEKLQQGETIDINEADTTMLKKIPGIGSYFAARIVELRQRRGTFASVEELLAIRNFPETALAYMTVSEDFPTIHINSATREELHAHPLLNFTQATDIMRLRRTNGRIHSLQELSLLPSLSTELRQRLAPLIIFD